MTKFISLSIECNGKSDKQKRHLFLSSNLIVRI